MKYGVNMSGIRTFVYLPKSDAEFLQTLVARGLFNKPQDGIRQSVKLLRKEFMKEVEKDA
jgi:Arc/MetJ-type ribon-helix-helix transcriptional regulator